MQTKKIPSTFFSMAQTALQKQGVNIGPSPVGEVPEANAKVRRRKRWQVRHPMRDLRLARGFTLEELAELTGLSPSYLSRLESGSRRLNADILQKLSNILGCNPGELLPYTPNGPASSQNVVPAPIGVHNLNAYDRKAQNQNAPTPDLPVYSARIVEGALRIDYNTPSEWMGRIPEFQGVTGAFALRLPDDRMAPRYARTDQIFAHPSRSLTPHCWVLIVREDNTIAVGRFLHWQSKVQNGIGPVEANENDVLSLQNIQNDAQIDEFVRKDIQGVYRIIGTSEVAA